MKKIRIRYQLYFFARYFKNLVKDEDEEKLRKKLQHIIKTKGRETTDL